LVDSKVSVVACRSTVPAEASVTVSICSTSDMVTQVTRA
jgi:hypothetical protein